MLTHFLHTTQSTKYDEHVPACKHRVRQAGDVLLESTINAGLHYYAVVREAGVAIGSRSARGRCTLEVGEPPLAICDDVVAMLRCPHT